MTTATITEHPVLTIRQTDLTTLLAKCPRSAYARAVDHQESPSYHGADRGRAVHDVFARYNEHLFKSGRQTDWGAIEAITRGVLAEYPMLSFEDREDVRSQAKVIGDTYLFDPTHYYGAEESFYYDLRLADGRVVRITGRLDLLLVDNDEGAATIRDAKSNHQLPPDSAISKDLQLTIYSLLVMRNLPHVDVVRGQLWFTRYGVLLPRKDEAVWTRDDLESFEDYLRQALAHFLDSRTHEAIPGTHCQYCSLRRPGKCTLWRSYDGVTPAPIPNEVQACKIARRVIAQEEQVKLGKALLKDYVNEHGPLSVGSGEYGEVWAFRASESEEIAPSDLLAILEEHRDLIGEQPLDDLLAVSRSSKAYKNLRYHPELRAAFDDRIQTVTGSSRFDHKKEVGADD